MNELAQEVQKMLIAKGYDIGESGADGIVGTKTLNALRVELSRAEQSKIDETLRAELEKQLRRDEGEKLHAYQDHLGYWTIGIGRLIDKRKGGRITPAESSYLFANDLAEKAEQVFARMPWAKSLSPARQGVLINMAFQMGVDGLMGFKNTLAMMQAGLYAEAAKGMLNSLWAKQTPERAKRLSVQMETDTWQ